MINKIISVRLECKVEKRNKDVEDNGQFLYVFTVNLKQFRL